MTYYKLARPDGFDFYTGRTINYREGIGGLVTAPDYRPDNYCGGGIHYSANPNDCFVGARIPCSAYEVEPVGRKHRKIDAQKSKAEILRVVREITDLDTLFGWRYSEAASPVHPLKLTPDLDGAEELLRQWASVGASVRASVRASVGARVWDSVWDSVGDSVGDSVWASVGASVGASVWASVRDSVWASVWASVWDSVWAYIGSLFSGITAWKHATASEGYPYQPAVDLWHKGLVPSFDGRTWRLHGYEDARVLLEVEVPDA